MKIVIMNTADIEGGAARCAYRLHKGLLHAGESSTYIVQDKYGTDEDVLINKTIFNRLAPIIRPALDRLPIRVYRNRKNGYFSTGLVTHFNAKAVNTLDPDIINLHYVASGFLPINSLAKFNRPLVWTLHDSWPFTGGCHLPGDCKRYEDSCGACPMLGAQKEYDLSFRIWKKKLSEWGDLNITVVTDSTWLADCAKKSSLFKKCRVEAINPGLDVKRYRQIDKRLARSLLFLPEDKKLILFGAMHSTSDLNKGFQFLLPAIQTLAKTPLGEKSEVIIFGASSPSRDRAFGIKANYLGRLHDDLSLAVLYSAADVMVVPSIRESFGQTASEAMACGTPVVAFGATGLLDTVEHQKNGYAAVPYSIEDLANGIQWILSLPQDQYDAVSRASRHKAENAFSIELMTQKYQELFTDVIRTSPK